MRGELMEKPHSQFDDYAGQLQLQFRHASDGFWLIILIPFSLLCGIKYIDQISLTYLTVSVISIGLLISSICMVLEDKKHWSIFTTPCTSISSVCSPMIVSILLIFIQKHGVTYSLCIAVISCINYGNLYEKIVHSCPKSFTYGEAAIVSQSLVLYLAAFALNTISYVFYYPNTCEKVATYVLQAGYFTGFTTLMTAYYYREPMKQLKIFISALCSLFFTFTVCLPYLVLRKNSLSWLLDLISDPVSIGLIVHWIFCCLFSVYCLVKLVITKKPASTASRKNFHFAILFIIIPGLVFRPCLMYVASGLGFAVLGLLETIRQLQLTKFSQQLQSCFDMFKDHKDEGSLALTPIYLMVGCAVPFWLYPKSYKTWVPLPVLSGVLSIAVGDTAASICGTRFGRLKWPGTEKTVEGTVGSIVSQMFVVILLSLIGVIETLSPILIYKCLFVITVSSIVEGITDQIDNLVLPLISYILSMLLFY